MPHIASSRPANSWRLLSLLMAMTAMGPVALNILVPAVPQLATKFSAEAGVVQLTISLFLFSLATGQLLLGPLSDRFGRRPVVLAGLTLATVASFAAMAAPSIGLLIAARVVQAIGAATGVVIGRAIIRDLYDRDRAAAMMGLVTTAMVVAPMIAPMIGGLLDTAFGWEAIFLTVALFSLLVLAWSTAALTETRPPSTDSAQTTQWREWKALLTNRRFHAYALAGAFGTAPFFVFVGGAPHVVVSIMGRTSAEYGLWFTISSLGYMSGNFAVSRLSERYGIDRLIRWGLLIELVGAVGCALILACAPANTPAMLFIPQVIISFGNGLMLPNALSGAIGVRPQASGAASGMTGFMQMALGAVCAQAISHVLAEIPSALPLPLVTIALLCVALATYAWFGRFNGRSA